jgi:hypothetical protein
MANLVINSDESIYATCNNASATPSTEVVEFRKGSSGTSVCTFNEDGTVDVYGPIEKASGSLVIRNSAAGDGEVLDLYKDTTKRFSFYYASGAARMDLLTGASAERGRL